MSIFLTEDHMLDWHSCQIYNPLEIKLLLFLLLLLLLLHRKAKETQHLQKSS